ncbi:MAG: N-acyl homoserine lactonase family protein [Alphaproteobacteria bacterium]|nr:N-acyl homoserine lactonase family protein [Alphaproteobacteria bacterium]
MGEPQVWELFAIKYATMQERTRATNLMGIDPHEDAPMPIDYYIWVARAGARLFVIDTGFTAEEGRRRGRTVLRDVADGLAMLGIDAATVEDVIVTHLHYDHIGGHDRFPRARYHLQAREMQYVTGPYMCAPAIRHSYTVDHVVEMVRRVYEDRVVFYEGEAEIAPGITVHPMPGHTMGLMSVRVLTKRGWVVVASDATHFYENMERRMAFPTVFNVGDAILTFDRLQRLAGDRALIVPGHDPQVLARYPPPDIRLDGIVCRLDVAPKAI